jgi:hypothetical protein
MSLGASWFWGLGESRRMGSKGIYKQKEEEEGHSHSQEES